MIKRIVAFGAGVAGALLLLAGLVGLPVSGVITADQIHPLDPASPSLGYKLSLGKSSALSRLVPGDTVDQQESTLQLYEDGQLIGPAHASHATIGNQGGGRYSYWHNTLYFSAVDNSDPRSNGRVYRWEGEIRVSLWLMLMAGALLATALWLLRLDVGRTARALAANERLKFPLSMGLTAVVVLSSVSLLWLFNLLISAREDVSQEDVFWIIGYCAGVVALQAALLLLLRKWRLQLFVLFGLSNAYLLFFVFSPDLTTQPLYLQGMLLFSVACLYFVLFQVLRGIGNARGWVATAVCTAALLVGIFGVAPIGAVHVSQPSANVTERAGLLAVDFAQHPNVYFLGFDALMPLALTKKLMEFDDPGYVDVVREFGGTVIPNLFADQIPTTRFWATTMNIRPIDNPKIKEFVTGIQSTTLLSTFRNNGFDTHFTFWNAFMGANHGPLLDHYNVANPYSTCSFLDDLPKRVGFFGYCQLSDVPPDKEVEELNAFYLDRLRSVTRDTTEQRHFFAAHYPSPGHTSQQFRGEEEETILFLEQYRDRSVGASALMRSMLDEILQYDSESIVFVFGDHGSFLSTGKSYEGEPEFVVQDRHGIFGALFGADHCTPYLQPPNGENFQTSSRVVAGILQCLAGGTSVLKFPYDFGKISTAPINMRFEDYVYE